jgi:hypothetical protein
MKFAKFAFWGAGVWGIVILTPLYFLFDKIGSLHSSPITYPQFYYGFVGVAMAWQFAFLVIGSDPARFRWMMIPSMAEKLTYGLTMGVLYGEGRIAIADVAPVFPADLVVRLFALAFAKCPSAARGDAAFGGFSITSANSAETTGQLVPAHGR